MAKEIPKLTEMARHVIRDIHPMVSSFSIF